MAARKEVDPTERVLQEIALGRHDAQLLDLATAITARAVEANVSSTWVLNVDGIHIEEDDLTIDMLDLVERKTSVPWSELTLARMAQSVGVLRTVIEGALIFRDGMTPEDAHSRVGKLRAKDVSEGFSAVPVDPT